MPGEAAEACEDFQTFLIWWMDKVDSGADETVVKRSLDRVEGMREKIPDLVPVTRG
jgi:hypothetical protein